MHSWQQKVSVLLNVFSKYLYKLDNTVYTKLQKLQPSAVQRRSFAVMGHSLTVWNSLTSALLGNILSVDTFARKIKNVSFRTASVTNAVRWRRVVIFFVERRLQNCSVLLMGLASFLYNTHDTRSRNRRHKSTPFFLAPVSKVFCCKDYYWVEFISHYQTSSPRWLKGPTILQKSVESACLLCSYILCF